MKLAGTGVWSAGLVAGDQGEVADTVAELESLGYTSLWIPGFGRSVFEGVDRLLAATDTIGVATGILSVWILPADEVADQVHAVRRRHGDRFLLGLGVSHASIVESVVEGARFEKPMAVMEAFLDGLDSASRPVEAASRLLAALGPRMVALSGRRAAGAHPYNVTPDHTAEARRILGPSRQLIPEQAVLLDSDAASARRLGREFLHHYLSLPNYVKGFHRMGFTDEDLSGGGSDRFVDALIAWGDVDTIGDRVRAHYDAGANGVCIQVVSEGGLAGMTSLPRPVWRELAPALTGL